MSKQWIVRFWDIYTSFVGVVIKFMNELKQNFISHWQTWNNNHMGTNGVHIKQLKLISGKWWEGEKQGV